MKKKTSILYTLSPSVKLCTDFYVFDVETGMKKRDGYIYWRLDARPESFIFGVIYGLNFTKVIYSVEEFKQELKDPKYKNKKVFAHNAQYDLNTIFGNIFLFDPYAIFNGKFICATNGNCVFADSMNIFIGAGVADLGKMQGLEKETLGEPGYRSKGITQKDINYCIRDCQIVWDALLRSFEFAGDIKITQASLSMTYFRRYQMPHHIEFNSNVSYFFDSYFGGRTEAFKIGKTHSKVIDVNSMYPDRMKNTTFPNPRTLKIEKRIDTKTFLKYLYWYEGLAYCKVEHKKTTFGFLPYKKDGKLIFPTGVFSGCWNFNELRFAIEQKAIKILKVSKVVYGEKMESPFASFVDTLQDKKIKAEVSGDDLGRSIAKYYSNSLYGKFAQRITEESIYIEDINKQWDLIREYQSKFLFVKLQMFNKDRNDAFLIVNSVKTMTVSYCIPSFASYITSAARVELLKKMLAMEKNSIVYCDTDSIFFEIDDGIISSLELGGWKVENKIVTEIKGLKNYKYINTSKKEVWRVKGVPVDKGKTVKLFEGETEKEVKIVEQISSDSFIYYNLVKSKEALKRKIEPGQLIKRNKTVKNIYDKREILKNGLTKPIYIYEEL